MTRSSAPRDRAEERRRTQADAARWSAELVARFSAAAPEERAAVLSDMDLPHILNEDAALALYRTQPQLVSEFIQRHLPRGRRADDASSPWSALMEQAQARGDEPLYFTLYRAQVASERWIRDTDGLASSVTDAHALNAELERRHPSRWRTDIGPQLVALALQRGADVLEYVSRHAPEIWSSGRRSGYAQMSDLARRQGWLELWAILVRTCATTTEYDREVQSLVADRIAPEPDLRYALGLLSGSGAEAFAVGRVKLLRDPTVLALYERFPDLLRGPYRPQLEPAPSRPLTGVTELAIQRKDNELLDALCSRLALRAERSGADRLLQVAALAARYLQMAEPEALDLGRRAVSILLRVPSRSIRNQRDLLRRNPLSRLLFESAAAACVATSDAATALLNAEEDHVCAIAVHALTTDDPRAAPLARENLGKLLAALDRRLPRTVMRQAVQALDRLAQESAQALQVLAWARDALIRKGPTDELVDLVARQLALHPDRRGEGEHPVVYRRAAA